MSPREGHSEIFFFFDDGVKPPVNGSVQVFPGKVGALVTVIVAGPLSEVVGVLLVFFLDSLSD